MLSRLTLTVLLGLFAFGQSKAQYTAGDDNVTTQGAMTWNIGALVTEVMANSQGGTDAPVTIEELGEITATVEYNEPIIDVYPNPVVDFLTVNFDKPWNVNLCSAEGKIIYQGGVSTIDMKGYPQGTYILSVLDRNKILLSSYKIVKQ